MKTIHIITLFPQAFDFLFETGVVGSALRGERGDVPKLKFVNPSDYNDKGFKGVDAAPYGGGAGQVMRADCLEKALLEGIIKDGQLSEFDIIYLGPRGQRFDQGLASELQKTCEQRNIVFICGRYEGIDERFLQRYVNRHISLGDFVLSGGELGLIPILDAVFRLMPGVLGNSDSPVEESFDGNGLEFPQYTKPQLACGEEVPKVLLSGHHENIKKWRHQQRLEMTKLHRPDLVKEKAYEAKEKRKK